MGSSGSWSRLIYHTTYSIVSLARILTWIGILRKRYPQQRIGAATNLTILYEPSFESLLHEALVLTWLNICGEATLRKLTVLPLHHRITLCHGLPSIRPRQYHARWEAGRVPVGL
ncbi:hypothetical protein SODALDRAFT_191469 [Sodiomyces alkalinus F11]|uniref:Uncharacterized protein n=1 Tax=Sodiomyces alkalinus (strain CBS 110278 / VKM F-3762 / F11) TaxID=1314773 RepID=A0A3N2PRT3_SODAK|nr:hypothetical protein SODALDRAFT_191469 [Sodiomyces alkalinus F11]ROT37207.1 hypothetical protein SODALDRAFT_191469 [Sodiomyces alkalinus F11]